MLNIPFKARLGWTLQLVEKVFAVLAFFYFSGAVVLFLEEANVASEEFFRVAIPLSVLAINSLLIALYHRQAIAVVQKEKLLWVLLALALASALWSENPAATLRRFLVLLNATAFGTYFAARYSVKEQLQLLGWTLGTAAVLSLLCVWALPQYGVMGMGSSIVGELQEIEHQGTWRGVYPHKNVLGTMMVLSTFVFFLLAQSSRQHRWLSWAGCSLSVGLVVCSTSVAALSILGFAIAAWVLYQILQWSFTSQLRRRFLQAPYVLMSLLIGFTALVAVFGIFNLEMMLNAVERDFSLSGRTRLWSLLLSHIWERPWLGHGYGGFWLVSDASQEIRQVLGDWAAHSHNGLLDLWLDLGFLGLSVFIYSFLTVCFQAALSLRQRPLASLWAFVYLAFLLLCNVSESALFNSLAIFYWLLYVTVVLSLHKVPKNVSSLPKGAAHREAMGSISSARIGFD